MKDLNKTAESSLKRLGKLVTETMHQLITTDKPARLCAGHAIYKQKHKITLDVIYAAYALQEIEVGTKVEPGVLLENYILSQLEKTHTKISRDLDL